MNLYPYLSGAVNPEPLPFNYGGDGRYMYFLVCNLYTIASPTTQSVKVLDTDTDTVVETITLTANKDFASIFYRAVDQTVHVVGTNWVDVIDADPSSDDFNTIIDSRTWTLSGLTAATGTYLPYPFDIFTSGGASVQISGGETVPKFLTSDGDIEANIRLGGHSNSINVHYYHLSNIISANRTLIKVINARSKNCNKDYSFAAHIGGGWTGDLQGFVAPVIMFGNFMVASTGGNIYLLSNENITSSIIGAFGSAATANRSFQEYCPNAPDKLFFTSQITNNFISVFEFGDKELVDLGDIDRASYKDTNESGANALIYNPYSGKLYCQANANTNTSGVTLVHIYDPTEAVLGDMYQGSVTIGEFKSDARSGAQGLNTVCMNRTRIFEYQDITI
jgi:hypothetical protein